MLKNLFGKINLFVAKLKFFITSNPRRTKFIGIIALAIIVPLIVGAALTIQNLSQHASQNGGLEVVDQNGNPITETSDPNVFLKITLPNDWIISPSSPQGNNIFVKQAFAQNADNKTCTDACFNKYPDADVIGNSDALDSCLATCSTPITPTILPLSPAPVCFDGTKNRPSGTICHFDSNLDPDKWCDGNGNCSIDLTPTPTPIPSSGPANGDITSTPTVRILKKLYVSGEGTNFAMDAQTWNQRLIAAQLNPLSPSENSAPRKINVTLMATDGFQTTLSASVTLKRAPNTTTSPASTTLQSPITPNASGTAGTTSLSSVEIVSSCPNFPAEEQCTVLAIAYNAQGEIIKDNSVTYAWNFISKGDPNIAELSYQGNFSYAPGDVIKVIARKPGSGEINVLAIEKSNNKTVSADKPLQVTIEQSNAGPNDLNGNGKIEPEEYNAWLKAKVGN